MKKSFAKSFILIVALVLIHQLMQHETRACNVAVVTAEASATGRPFIWKNRDHANSYKIEVKYFPSKSGFESVGGSMRVMGETTWGSGVAVCTGGANESGFAIANTTCVDGDNDPFDLNNVNTELMEVSLEECKTLAEFEEIASEFTDRWTDKNISGIFAVIDAQDGAALYEMWTNGNGNDIMYRKFDAHTGNVTDENGSPFSDIRYTQTVGFNNRTNSNHTDGWIDIWTDTPRELRARQLMTEMLANDELSPRNMMREVAKDVCGGNPADYCSTETKVMNSWDGDNSDNDSYLNPNRDGQMYTRYCISRYQTNMGLVVEGASSPDEANLTTMWVSLGEPSLSVFVPFFPAAQSISKYATDDTHEKRVSNTSSSDQYYWNGTWSSSDNGETSFINLLFDCVGTNPFGSSHPLYNTYRNIELYKNNGSGAFFWDTQDRNNGGTYLLVYTKMDTTIDYPRLMNLQTWTLPLEDNVFDRTDEYISLLKSNPDLISSEDLADFSNYCNRYVYQNYSHQTDDYVLWDRPLPDNGLAPEISSVNTGDGTGFPLTGSISVQFSEPIDESSINEDTFTVRIGSSRVAGDVAYDSGTRTATFYPSSPLACGSTYTAILTDDIEDLSGRSLEGSYSWTFNTVACGSIDPDPEDPEDPDNPVMRSSSSGGGDGCGSAAEASTMAGGTRPILPGVMSLMVTMLLPLSLMTLHRRARRRDRR
ncbi:MAG TPA: Ig-like domain-containing protein [Spirochaetota bacterium]|nr:Ig-like domain-containing protein [Spirochaetota bacterium]